MKYTLYQYTTLIHQLNSVIPIHILPHRVRSIPYFGLSTRTTAEMCCSSEPSFLFRVGTIWLCSIRTPHFGQSVPFSSISRARREVTPLREIWEERSYPQPASIPPHFLVNKAHCLLFIYLPRCAGSAKPSKMSEF